jgi:TonB family protein
MNQIKHLIVLSMFLLVGQNLIAQSANEVKAKAYYFSAETSFENKQYSSTLELLDKAVETGNGTNAYIEALRVKTYAAKKDWTKAKKSLDKLYKLNPDNETLRDLSPLIIKIDEEYEKAKEKEKQRIIAEREAELKKLQQAKAEQERKQQIMASSEKRTVSKLQNLQKIEEGRVYAFKPDYKITTSTTERTYIVFYDQRYLIVTIPSEKLINPLNKSKISFSTYNVGTGDYDTKVKVKTAYGKKELKFRKVTNYNNVFIGGLGDDMLWHGEQYTTFNKKLYYYYYKNTLHVTIKLKTYFQSKYYNPYFETGTINKYIDYSLVGSEELKSELQAAGVSNRNSKSLSNPILFNIRLKPENRRHMLVPQKDITYQLQDEKVSGEFTGNGKRYTWGFLYFSPKSRTSYYGMQVYSTSISSYDVLKDIYVPENLVTIDLNTFNSLYKNFSNNTAGKHTYFTSSSYTLPYDILKKFTTVSSNTTALLQYSATPKPESSASSYGSNSSTDSSEVFTFVEEKAEFPGGQAQLNRFIASNVVYPEAAIKAGIEGKVILSFIVEKDGSISNVKVIRGVHESLDKEALRVINSMPKWKPGTQRGKAIRSLNRIPVNFKLG